MCNVGHYLNGSVCEICTGNEIKSTPGDATNCSADAPCDGVTSFPNADHSACAESPGAKSNIPCYDFPNSEIGTPDSSFFHLILFIFCKRSKINNTALVSSLSTLFAVCAPGLEKEDGLCLDPNRPRRYVLQNRDTTITSTETMVNLQVAAH